MQYFNITFSWYGLHLQLSSTGVCVCVCVCVHVCVSTYCSLRTSINVCLYSFIKRMGGGRLYPPFHPSTLPHTHTHFWNINQHWSTEGMSAYVFLYDKTDIICSI